MLKQVENLPISKWIKMAQMAIRRKGHLLQLVSGKGIQDNVEVDTWVPVSNLVINSDILVLNPRFEVVSTRKTANRLYLQIALTFVKRLHLSFSSFSLGIIIRIMSEFILLIY